MTEERLLVPFNEEMLFKVLEIVQQDAVLVGGQAVAVWVGIYEISPVNVSSVKTEAKHPHRQENMKIAYACGQD